MLKYINLNIIILFLFTASKKKYKNYNFDLAGNFQFHFRNLLILYSFLRRKMLLRTMHNMVIFDDSL